MLLVMSFVRIYSGLIPDVNWHFFPRVRAEVRPAVNGMLARIASRLLDLFSSQIFMEGVFVGGAAVN